MATSKQLREAKRKIHDDWKENVETWTEDDFRFFEIQALNEISIQLAIFNEREVALRTPRVTT
jgi:hypothetical protein